MIERRREKVTELVKAFIKREKPLTSDDVERILEQIAKAPFSTRLVVVHPDLLGVEYLGYRYSEYAPSDLAHLGKRVIVEAQWKQGATLAHYLTDARSVARHKEVRIVVYRSRGVNRVGLLCPNVIPKERLGINARPWLWVVYDADRDIITTGYQISGIGNVWLPEDARWL